jgi:predicted component of type VI protein secretion system
MASPTLGGDDLPGVVLKFPRRPNKPSRLPVDRVLALVGRSPVCRFRLKDASVSAFHCSLLRTPLGVWVIDLGGRGGIRVNGADVRWARLNDGDELGVGEYRLFLQCDAPPARPVSPGRSSGAGVSTVESATDLVLRPAGRVGLPRLIPGAGPGQAPEGWAPGRAEAVDPLLVHLVSQFSSMQQQMFDQYNQSMMMMSQMFGALQRDQMGLVREELDRLQQLTRELQVLQVEAAKQPSSPPLPSPVAPSRPTPGLISDPARRGIEEVRNGATAPEPRTPSAESGIPPPGLADRPAPARPPLQAHDDVHAWLNHRIATIQEERQGLWQKILGMVMGQPESGVLP